MIISSGGLVVTTCQLRLSWLGSRSSDRGRSFNHWDLGSLVDWRGGKHVLVGHLQPRLKDLRRKMERARNGLRYSSRGGRLAVDYRLRRDCSKGDGLLGTHLRWGGPLALRDGILLGFRSDSMVCCLFIE